MNLLTFALLGLFCFLTVASLFLMRYVFNSIGFEMSISFIFGLLFQPLFILSLATGLSSRFVFYAMFSSLNVSETFLLSLVSMVFVLGMGAVCFKDVLNGRQLIGAAMIVGGAGLVGL